MSPNGVRADTSVPTDPGRDGTGTCYRSASVLHFLTATEVPNAAEFAAEQVRQLDQLALIGYSPLDPATRAVYEVTLRLGAEKLLDAVGEGR